MLLKSIKRTFLCLLLCAMIPCTQTYAEDLFPAAPMRDKLIRVYLTRMGIADRMDISLDTAYLLSDSTGQEMYFRSGSSLSFQLKNNTIYLYYEGMTQRLGKELTLERAEANTDSNAGFRLTNYPAQYWGDLKLDVVENKLRPILTIHVEDYLLGVVPYEMGNDFPLEALKAQAVAARTYALRSQSKKETFDVYDNTNDQVFRGYYAGNDNAERAIKETTGVCGFYNDKLAQCFYSASNGGQTELVQMVWPSREKLEYYQFGPDPYDVENPASTVRSFALMKQYKGQEAPSALRTLITDQLTEQLSSGGWDTMPEGIRVDKVNSVIVDSPNMYNSKLMTMLHIELEISVRKRQNVQIQLIDTDTEEVNLFTVQDAEVTPSTTTAFNPVVTLEPEATAENTFGPYVPWHESVLIDIPIFPQAENAFQLSINSNYENEIWSVVETDEAFTIEVRRFGHGVGMSQRGAQVMAEKYQKNYQEILAFYYPGMYLKQYPAQGRGYVVPEDALSATAGPAPSPTPRPTLMPATLVAGDGQWYAAVTGIADDSSLNLRSAPSLNSDILMRLYKGQRLLVLERCEEEGWVHVKTDVAEGYVMESYLSSED